MAAVEEAGDAVEGKAVALAAYVAVVLAVAAWAEALAARVARA